MTAVPSPEPGDQESGEPYFRPLQVSRATAVEVGHIVLHPAKVSSVYPVCRLMACDMRFADRNGLIYDDIYNANAVARQNPDWQVAIYEGRLTVLVWSTRVAMANGSEFIFGRWPYRVCAIEDTRMIVADLGGPIYDGPLSERFLNEVEDQRQNVDISIGRPNLLQPLWLDPPRGFDPIRSSSGP